MTKLRMAVIGVGSLGQHHARVCRDLEMVDLIGVADIVEKRAKSVAKRNETTWTTDYTQLIDQVDAASIAVPTTHHFEIARAFLNAGKPVLIEKPITASLEEARELVALADRKGVPIQVGHIERFNPAMQAAAQYAASPVFMECHRLSPFKFRSADIGVVLDLMIHDLDIILHLAKSPIASVDAVGVNVMGPTEDLANARIRFESGCVANLTASRCALKTLRKIRVFSPQHYVGLDFGNKYAVLIKKTTDVDLTKIDYESRDWSDLSDLQRDFRFEDFLTVEELKMDDFEPLLAEIRAFAMAVIDGTEPVVSGLEGLRAVEAADMVMQSIRSNAWYPQRST